jgi:hypothetical protein
VSELLVLDVSVVLLWKTAILQSEEKVEVHRL